MKQSVALKYQSFLSRNVKCLGVNLRLPKLSLSDENVDKFNGSLDIGQIPDPRDSKCVTNFDRVSFYDY